MATGGILLVMYVLNVVAKLIEGFDNLKYFSFFHYYNYNDALIRNTLDTAGVLVFVGAAVIFTAAGALWFHKRDVVIYCEERHRRMGGHARGENRGVNEIRAAQ